MLPEATGARSGISAPQEAATGLRANASAHRSTARLNASLASDVDEADPGFEQLRVQRQRLLEHLLGGVGLVISQQRACERDSRPSLLGQASTTACAALTASELCPSLVNAVE